MTALIGGDTVFHSLFLQSLRERRSSIKRSATLSHVQLASCNIFNAVMVPDKLYLLTKETGNIATCISSATGRLIELSLQDDVSNLVR